MSTILKFLVGPIAGPLFGGVALFLLAAVGTEYAVLSWKIASLEADKAKLQDSIGNAKTGYLATIAQCEVNAGTYSKSLDRLAGEVKTLANDTAARDKANAARMSALNGATQAVRLRADQILALPKPAPANACAAATAVLRGETP